MATHSTHPLRHGALTSSVTARQIGRKTAEVVLVLVALAAVAVAWFALFSFVPFDLTLRPR